MKKLQERAGEVHADSVHDTGAAYTAFQGWLLTCLWCDFECRAFLKRDAVVKMQAHYDALCPGRVDVLMRRAEV